MKAKINNVRFNIFITGGSMKIMKTLIAVLTLTFLICIPGFGKTDTAAPADLVIKNAKIITVDKDNKRAEAVAVKGEFIIAADKMSFQVAIHAIGPKGSYLSLNAIEKAIKMNGKRDSRHRIEHAQFLIDSDISRFAQLGVIASMQPTHCITDKRFAEKRVGRERCKGAYAWRSLLDTGARIAFGTDYAEFMEDRKGMIKKGYLADMVILNQDLMTIPHDRIMSTKVDTTIVGGMIVYQREGTE
jgi:predicted amidohydrolase YtcJ